jgi:S-DNA-T family DNA segregation ATPase FtsK/SpoIIIE
LKPRFMGKMTTAKSETASPKADAHHFKAYMAQGSREGALILLIAICVFLLMALISHHPADPGFASTGSHKIVQNYGGKAGAWSADILLYFFGNVAYLFPLLIAYRASVIFKFRRQRKGFHWPMFLIRFIGFILTILGATGLLSLYAIAGLNDSSGGVIGKEFSANLLAIFNLSGSTLLLVAMLLLGLTVFTGISWLGLMDRTGAMTLRLIRTLRLYGLNLLDRLRDKRAAAKAHKPTQAVQKVQAAPVKALPVKQPVQINGSFAGSTSASVEKKSFKQRLLSCLPGKRTSTKGKQTYSQEPLRIEPDLNRSVSSDNSEPSEPILIKAGSLTQKSSSEELAVHSENDQPAKTGIKISPFVKKSQQKQADEKQGHLFIASEGPLPSLNLLDPAEAKNNLGYSKETLEYMSRLLEEKLADFGVKAEVVEVNPGPVITRFEIQPAPGVKVSKISNLAKDLARSLAVLSVRVVEVIPGKSVVGIEIPNEHREIVRFRSVLQSKEYDDSDSPVTLALGNDIAGDPVVVNLAKMPHLLVAGTTGSGKSVGVNSMILSMLFKAQPDEVRFIMVDPKMLELSIYDGIPHLLTPVVTDMKEAANALRWCVAEMERRYKLMAQMGVRNVAGFNRKVKDAIEKGEPLLDPLWQPDLHLQDDEQFRPELTTLPFIVVIIDEFADMMMIVGKKVEELIARIAQKARAAGIHLILATQRPSVDVITGLIKANVPTRISFQVSSKIDSRTVLDQGGAEQLLGHGDMLYMPPGTSVPIRVHGAFVDDHEVHRVVDDWKQRGEPNYLEDVLSGGESNDPIAAAFNDDGSAGGEQDALFDEAVAFVTETRRVSISSVQRKLKVGYNRAANLVEAMEQAGVVSAAGHNGSREVLAPPAPKD